VGARRREARAERLRARLLEVEQALIPMGLHVVGEGMPEDGARRHARGDRRGRAPGARAAPVAELLAGPGADARRAARRGRRAREAVAALVDPERGRRAAEQVLARAGARRGAAPRRCSTSWRASTRCSPRTTSSRGSCARSTRATWSRARRRPAAHAGGAPHRPQRVRLRPVPRAERRRGARGAPAGRPLLARFAADGHGVPESVAFVLWGTDNMKSEGAPIAQALALLGAVPRFDAVGRLAGARLVPLAQLGRPRVDVVLTLSGIFRDLLPLQVRLLAEAALLAASADEPAEQNFVRRHALATIAERGCTMEEAALRVFGNADGAYGSNVNLLVESGRWNDQDELAEQFVRRKCFAYGVKAAPVARPALMERALRDVSLSFQNLDSVELGATDIDQYVEALGGVQRAVARAKGAEVPAYLGDHTTQANVVRTLGEQVELESRTRLLNPKWYEAQLAAGYEGARNVAGHVTTTLGWSATGGAQAVPAWVYAEVGNTFVLDAAMRERLAALNPNAANAIAERLLEANDRGYWAPDAETLAALRDAAADLEDRLEGIPA
jgi:magnesium chelatase subunit H